MDEVKAMARAGEAVGKAVAASLDMARRAGQAGAEATVRAAQAAEQKLTEHGVGPQQLTEALAPNKARRLSIVRDGDKPPAACADGHGRDQDAVTAPKPASVV